jgi:hypothetical protein
MNWLLGERGWLKHLELTAIGAIALAGLGVMIGQSAERYADNQAQAVAQADAAAPASGSQGRNAPVFNAIDYATTGSVKGQTVLLSPCTGQETGR